MSKKRKSSAVDGRLVAAVNKKARRDYQILDVQEAGIVLNGAEVKSIRAGSANLKESYIRLIGSELFLVGCHISAYSHARIDGYDPVRDRKLLMHRREIDKLRGQIQEKGLTLVPLCLYFKNGRCKVELAVGRGKKLYDKREDIKAKDAKREMDRALKKY